MHFVRGIFIALVLLMAAPASASHYYLSDISERFSESTLAELERFGYATTEDVLRNVLTAEARATLSEATGIPEAELVELARMCEFLQVPGVGPRAFDLLLAAGVADVRDLVTRAPDELMAELAAANAIHGYTGANPHLEVVAGWVSAAASVPLHVEY